MNHKSIWNVRLEKGEPSLYEESLFMNSKNIEELILKKAQLSTDVEANMYSKIETLANIMNSDQMMEVPPEVKNYILDLFSDMVRIVSKGELRLIVRKPSGS
jgi:hypothetical protein